MLYCLLSLVLSGLCSRSMRSRDYETAEHSSVRLSVRLSVRHIIRPLHATAAGLLLWARRPGDIDRLLHGRRSAANCEQCRPVSWRRRLNIVKLINRHTKCYMTAVLLSHRPQTLPPLLPPNLTTRSSNVRPLPATGIATRRL